MATCESGPTGSLGGLCRNTVPIRIRDSAPPPTPDVPPSAGEYIELYYSKDFSSKPHIVIVPSPDSYSQVSRHITPVMEGINMWVERLGQRYGGNWGVTFELMSSGKIFYDSKPDVVVNLVTYEEDGGCGTEYGGKAPHFPYPSGNDPNVGLLDIQ